MRLLPSLRKRNRRPAILSFARPAAMPAIPAEMIERSRDIAAEAVERSRDVASEAMERGRGLATEVVEAARAAAPSVPAVRPKRSRRPSAFTMVALALAVLGATAAYMWWKRHDHVEPTSMGFNPMTPEPRDPVAPLNPDVDAAQDMAPPQAMHSQAGAVPEAPLPPMASESPLPEQRPDLPSPAVRQSSAEHARPPSIGSRFSIPGFRHGLPGMRPALP